VAKIQILSWMINNPDTDLIFKKPEMSAWLQFVVFITLFIFIYIIGNLFAAGIIALTIGLEALTNTSSPHFMQAFWIGQLIGVTLPIFAISPIFSYFIVKDVKGYLKPGFKFSPILLLLVLAIMFSTSPIIELLSNINEKMPLPSYLKWMREMEDSLTKLMNTVLIMKTFWAMLANLLLIGLLTAIVEELMFRGCLQTILFKWTKNIHLAIWITAALFSAFHMEFFGFLPRLFLGALFGYFVAWSGSIWTSIWEHFLNNGTAVVVTYLYQQKVINLNPDNQHLFNYISYLISFIIVLFLLIIFRKASLLKKQATAY
jgi:membrane protease YdiL (CAAX protease family)